VTDAVTCPNGHHNTAGSAFCGVCGTVLGAATAPPPPPPPDGAAAPDPAPPDPPAAWEATHRTPAEGLLLRAEPDAERAAETHLPGNTPVRAVEWVGAWARVSTGFGREGWVDGRRLTGVDVVPAASGSPPPQPGPPPAPDPGTAPAAALAPGTGIALLGAGAAMGALFLPWLGSGALGVAPFDIPFTYLWQVNPQPSGFTIGAAGAILAGVLLGTLLLVVLRALPGRLGSGLASLSGGLFTTLVFAFGLQTVRLGLDGGLALGDVLADLVGLGAWIAFGGGILVAVGARLGGGIR
jgi:hypothetical protein